MKYDAATSPCPPRRQQSFKSSATQVDKDHTCDDLYSTRALRYSMPRTTLSNEIELDETRRFTHTPPTSPDIKDDIRIIRNDYTSWEITTLIFSITLLLISCAALVYVGILLSDI